MPDRIHNWPVELRTLISRLEPNPDCPDCYWIDIDLTSDEVKEVSLFEVVSRPGRVRFAEPSGRTLVGCMNPLVGLGAPQRPGTAARVRISFHAVSSG